jgi:hypothetical protein
MPNSFHGPFSGRVNQGDSQTGRHIIRPTTLTRGSPFHAPGLESVMGSCKPFGLCRVLGAELCSKYSDGPKRYASNGITGRDVKSPLPCHTSSSSSSSSKGCWPKLVLALLSFDPLARVALLTKQACTLLKRLPRPDCAPMQPVASLPGRAALMPRSLRRQSSR